MSKVLLLFIDGVGIGEANAEKNPFFRLGFKTFSELFGKIPSLEEPRLIGKNKILFPVDACLGVGGLPQSGTGQVAIFCGVNAAQIVGKHFGPFPYSTTIPIIKEQSIFQYYKEQGKNALFVNAYPKVFFDYMKSGKNRLSVTSLSATSAGHRLHNSTDVRNCKALTAEITNERWNKKLNYKIPVITPEGAARRLLRLASQNDFTLYEFFLTDHLGHGRIPLEFDEIYHNLDRFLYTVLAQHSEDLTVIVISDHGNIEDISTKSHTYNPALGIISGNNAVTLSEGVTSLVDIKKTIIRITG